jgi:hypothetical protein
MSAAKQKVDYAHSRTDELARDDASSGRVVRGRASIVSAFALAVVPTARTTESDSRQSHFPRKRVIPPKELLGRRGSPCSAGLRGRLSSPLEELKALLDCAAEMTRVSSRRWLA